MICQTCLIEHADEREALEMHKATARIHAYLRDWMRLVTDPIPVVVAAKRQEHQRPNPPRIAVRRTR
jgi:hypothetical protein